MRLIVRPEAEADIAQGYAWYELQRTGLGHRFIDEISRCLADIEREPFRFLMIRGDARRALLRRFPYAIFFVRGPAHISVVAAMHMARDPGLWHERIDRDV